MKNLVLITDVVLAAMFSGCEALLIPLVEIPPKVAYGDADLKYKLDFKNAFLGDDWYIQNEQIYGYNKGPFALGFQLERFNAHFCKTVEFENL